MFLFSERGRVERLLNVVDSEPRRVRALIGAIGEDTGKKPRPLASLRRTLNPLSRFDLGLLAGIPSAQNWQANGRRP